jgi:hypothetical protein
MEHTIMGHELTNARAVGPRVTKCTPEINALLPANFVSTATRKATSYGYAGNHLGSDMTGYRNHLGSDMTENRNGHEALQTG